MKLATPAGSHLTYCTNIHPGETWPEVRDALTTHVPAVKAALGAEGPFGVGLRISGRAAADLEDPDAFAELRDALDAHGLYVFTINGFPFGAFHGQRVKEGVYEPDWRSAERLAYTDRLARQLAAVLPDGVEGSVSTVPGAFKPNARDEADVAAIAENLLRHAATLWQLRQDTGKSIALAIEPEPECFLETTAEAIRFLENRVYSRAGRDRFAALTGLGDADTEAALRRHVGLCFDVCHAAVEYEDVPAALAALQGAGIRVPKAQLSTALRLPAVDDAAVARLRDFDDGVYLHQVVARRDGRLSRYLDLPRAFEAYGRGEAADSEWRIHFHVPVFLAELDGFASTQADLAAALDWLARNGGVPHLEVETYTWDVLPERHRGAPVDRAIARELTWTLDRLKA